MLLLLKHKDETVISTAPNENANFVHLLLPAQLRTVLSFTILLRALDEFMLTATILTLIRVSMDHATTYRLLI